MNRNIYRFQGILALVFGIALILAMPAYSVAQEEGVFLDPQTGDYRVRFKSYSEQIEEGIFYPHTKIDPVVKSKLKIIDDGSIVYRYKVRNGKTSKQNLITVTIDASNVHTTDPNAAVPNSPTQIIPSGWDGTIVPNIGKSGYIVGWSALFPSKTKKRHEVTSRGLPPSSDMVEFGFRSDDLPGVGIVRLRGEASFITMLPDEGPDPDSPVGIAYHKLRQSDFVPRPAAVPRIPVPAPFDAATVLTSLQKHVKDDLVGMALIDPILVSKLDPLFAAAIDAAQRGNAEGTRRAIKDIRHLLKREHEDVDKEDDKDEDDDQDDKKKDKENKRLIDKLAARVLDFDLKYVEKRAKGSLD